MGGRELNTRAIICCLPTHWQETELKRAGIPTWNVDVLTLTQTHVHDFYFKMAVLIAASQHHFIVADCALYHFSARTIPSALFFTVSRLSNYLESHTYF